MSEENTNRSNVPQIVRLTPAAVSRVKNILEKEGKQGYALRIGVVTGGCAGLSYDLRFQKDPYENDIIQEQDGVRILINPESIAFIQGSEIDYKDTLNESGFQYKNPNAKSSCGCGISFS